MLITYKTICDNMDCFVPPPVPSNLSENVGNYKVVQEGLTVIHRLYSSFRKFHQEPLHRHKDKTFQQAWEDLAENVLQESNTTSSIPSTLESMHRLITGEKQHETSLYRFVGKESEKLPCDGETAPHQLLYNVHSYLQSSQLKGYTMTQFSWMLLRLRKKGNFTEEYHQMRERYLKQMAEQAISLKRALAEVADAHNYRCASSKHQQEEERTHLRLNKRVEPGMRPYTSDNIVVGGGYSSDSQQVVAQVCYNASVASTTAQQGYIQLDNSISFSQLENKLGVTVSVSGKIGMFSAEGKASYLRSVQDNEYSISLNYYEYVTNNVAVQIAGYGEAALTESGKGFYKGGKNPYFGLLCGDHYISSYQQGALLSMGLNIKFDSSVAKNVFEEKAGATFGHIISATESVKAVVSKYKITGSVMIQAFQMGGDPSQLTEILNKDRTGQYYALTCSLDNMNNCVKAASGLLDYAKNNFSKQFSFKNNTGLTPLGIAFSQYNPIEYLGLTSPASLVTPEVKNYRYELFRRLKENEYYQQKFYPFYNKGYPVEIDAAFINKANSILSKANRNVGILRQTHDGAADCFNFPERCANITINIYSHLKSITKYDLKFLEAVKYTITTMGGMFYNTGSGILWGVLPDTNPEKEMLVKVNNFCITDERYSYDTSVHIPHESRTYEFIYNGDLNKSRNSYTGTMCFRLEGASGCVPPIQTNYPERKLISPFYFVVFNFTEWFY